MIIIITGLIIVLIFIVGLVIWQRFRNFKIPPHQIFIETTGFDDNPDIYLKLKDGEVILADGKFKKQLVKKYRQKKLKSIILERRELLNVTVKYKGENLILNCRKIEGLEFTKDYLKKQDPPKDTIKFIVERADLMVNRKETVADCRKFFPGKCFNEMIERSGYYVEKVTN